MTIKWLKGGVGLVLRWLPGGRIEGGRQAEQKKKRTWGVLVLPQNEPISDHSGITWISATAKWKVHLIKWLLFSNIDLIWYRIFKCIIHVYVFYNTRCILIYMLFFCIRFKWNINFMVQAITDNWLLLTMFFCREMMLQWNFVIMNL